MAKTSEGQASIGIPQLLAVAVVGFLAIRWFMNKPSTPSTGGSRRNRQVDPAKVDQVSAVFPHLDRRDIAWDLQQNGGNVSATTERVLSGRALDRPPPTYQPNLPATPASGAQPSASSSGAARIAAEAQKPDLIARYGLQSKVKGKEPEPSEEQKKSAWSSDKNARADALKKRREDMILAARRKMAEKDAQA